MRSNDSRSRSTRGRTTYYVCMLIMFFAGAAFSGACTATDLAMQSKALNAYRQELQRFRGEFGGSYDIPDTRFFLFGMGQRTKYLYKEDVLSEALTGKTLRKFEVANDVIVPPQYRVDIETRDGRLVSIAEDERGVWLVIGQERLALPGTQRSLRLPTFAEHPYPGVLRVLHQELLINILPQGPVPNFFVYDKPWYRDGAMMAMAFKETGNLEQIQDWIQGLRTPYDRNNAGETEADNLGQSLYLISLAPHRDHPLVQTVLAELPKFEKKGPKGPYILGRSDFSEHPVYQTKWLKFGLRSLGLKDPYVIPAIADGYSALFWMDYRDQHVQGTDADDRRGYPYLGWACDHFYGTKKSPISNRDYPLTWEAAASQARYAGIRAVSEEYAARELGAPHTWHAAEVFLYLLKQPAPKS